MDEVSHYTISIAANGDSLHSPSMPALSSLASKTFYVTWDTYPAIPDNDTEVLYIQSILSELMDALGDTFKLTLISKLEVSAMLYNVMIITFPVCNYVSEFKDRLADFVYRANLPVGVNERPPVFTLHIFDIQPNYTLQSPHHSATRYHLIAKDGVYIETKKVETVTEMKRGSAHHTTKTTFL